MAARGRLVVDGEVGEIEEDVAHAGVLPVDDPDALAVVDEVRVQQVVVAGPLGHWAAGTLDPPRELVRPDEALGNARAVASAVSR